MPQLYAMAAPLGIWPAVHQQLGHGLLTVGDAVRPHHQLLRQAGWLCQVDFDHETPALHSPWGRGVQVSWGFHLAWGPGVPGVMGSQLGVMGSRCYGVLGAQPRVKVSWGPGVMGSQLFHRRNVGFWCEMGTNMSVEDLEAAVKKTFRALAAGEDVLVHCKRGKHRSGAFICFLLALYDEKPLMRVVEKYCEDPFLYSGDRKWVTCAVHESRLLPLLDQAFKDSAIQHVLAELRGKESRSQEVKASRSQDVHLTEATAKAMPPSARTARMLSDMQDMRSRIEELEESSRRPGVQDSPAAKRQRSSGSSSSTGPSPSTEGHEWNDWRCPECGNRNRWWRSSCNFMHCQLAWWKPGDWICPACGNHNYKSRDFCNAQNCGAAKP